MMPPHTAEPQGGPHEALIVVINAKANIRTVERVVMRACLP
jgi:hypothetical protein